MPANDSNSVISRKLGFAKICLLRSDKSKSEKNQDAYHRLEINTDTNTPNLLLISFQCLLSLSVNERQV